MFRVTPELMEIIDGIHAEEMKNGYPLHRSAVIVKLLKLGIEYWREKRP